MSDAYVVIGSGYGDEGKGLITSFLAKEKESKIVVRFNGGAQAAHTVCNDDMRYVFRSVGSGTFSGSDTYLSENFIFNPFVLKEQLSDLSRVGYSPRVFCHPESIVTSLYDIAINWVFEMSRGEKRHGSCGLGINETVTRSENGFDIRVKDLYDKPSLIKKIKRIKTDWVPRRLSGIEVSEEMHKETGNILRGGDDVLHASNLIDVIKYNLIPTSTTLSHISSGVVVFEGAQGLGLDQDHGHFPHVTRSNTGLYGALHAMDVFEVKKIHPVYVTRCYATRHGDGPLLHEGEIGNLGLHDQTNMFNRFQGGMRFAPLDLNELTKSIKSDIVRCRTKVSVQDPVIAVTCMDQMDQYPLYKDGILGFYSKDEFLNQIETETGMEVKFLSFGPKTSDVMMI